MTPSPTCAALIKSFEKCSKAILNRPGWFGAYWATMNEEKQGKASIGWGSTGPDVRMGMIWSQQMCDDRFDRDLEAFGLGVDHELDRAPTTQNQFDALVSLAYNIGLEAEQHSTLVRLHCVGDYEEAALQFTRWDHQGGVELPGLLKRREAEQALYRGSGPQPGE